MAADLRTAQHLLIAIGEPLTALRASLACLGADSACTGVKTRAMKHEVRAGGTDLRAIKQLPDVAGFGMLSAHFQTMICCLDADVVAFSAA